MKQPQQTTPQQKEVRAAKRLAQLNATRNASLAAKRNRNALTGATVVFVR